MIVIITTSKNLGNFLIYCSFFLSISDIYPAVIIPAGNATIAIPNKAEIIVITLPIIDTAYKSPYPTVVSEIVAQYIASKNKQLK